jgi:hypothetical protein
MDNELSAQPFVFMYVKAAQARWTRERTGPNEMNQLSRSTHKSSLVDGPDHQHFEIEFTRDETRNAWLITATRAERVLFSGEFPANFHTDKRSAREFALDFTVMLWPTSSAADMAREHAAAAKRNRHKVM